MAQGALFGFLRLALLEDEIGNEIFLHDRKLHHITIKAGERKPDNKRKIIKCQNMFYVFKENILHFCDIQWVQKTHFSQCCGISFKY